MADPTNPEDTAAAFDKLNETLRQFQDTLGSSLESLATSMNAAAKATTARETAAAAREIAAKKEAEANKALNDQVKRLQDAYGDAYEIQGKLNKYGEVEITQTEKSIAQRQKQDQLDQEILEQAKKRAGDKQVLSDAELLLAEKELIQKKKSQKVLEDELRQIGKKLDENGKILNIDKQLLAEDEKKLTQAKKQYRIEEQNRQTLENIGESFTKFAKDFGKLGLNTAFDFLKASVVGTYKAQVAYEDALLAGETGYSVQAGAIAAQMNEMAGAMDRLGGGLVTLGTETVATGIKMALAGGPIGLLVAAVGALLAVFGYAAQVEAENTRRTAELKKKQAALFDELFKDFGALGEASMGSSRGMTGLKDDLAKVGLTIKEFDKLNRVLKENAKEMSMLGAGTVGGIKNFLDVSAGLISSELGKTFREMGIDRDAMMEHSAKYMAQEQRFGLMQQKSVQDQAKAAGAYIVELDKMAALTGATRKEQEAAREAVMQIQSLRAAMMKARASGDTQEAERLKRYLDVATAFQAQGMTEQAKGTAELAAGKGPTSEASAMVMQASPQMVDMLDKNIGTTMERYSVGLKEFKDWALNFADAASVGADMSKLVGDYGKIDDANIKLEQLVELQKKNPEKSLDQLLVEMRKNKDPETEKRVAEEEKNRKEALEVQEKLLNGQALASQEMTGASGIFNSAAKLFKEAVDKLVNWFKEFFNWGTEKTQTTIAPRTGDQGQLVGGAMGEGDGGAIMEAAREGKAEREAKPSTAGTKEGTMGNYVSRGQTAPEAPKKELGGIVPGTIDGTTVTVGEKGKPEAIIPLNMLSEMLNTKSKSPIGSIQQLFGDITKDTKSKSPLDSIQQMFGDITKDTKSKSPVDEMQKYANMLDINKDLFDINDKTFELSVKQFDLAKVDSNLTELSNKLTEKQTSIIDEKLIKSMNAEIDTSNKLIISMNKVTEMLPGTVQKIIDAAAAPASGGGGTTAAPAGGGSVAAPAAAPTGGGGRGSGSAAPAGGSSAAPVSGSGASPAGGSSGKPGESAMAKAGAFSEVQSGPSVNTGKEIHTGGTVSWRTNNPGNVSYGDLAKQYGAIGTWKNPDGDQQQRTTGIAIMPSLEDGDKLKMGLWKRPMYIDKTIDQGVAQWTGTSGLGSAYAKDLANAAGATLETKIRELSDSQLGAMIQKQRAWEGFKPGKVEPIQAFDGGVFEPRPGGVHVNLAEAGLREAAVPLNPGEKIRVEKSEQENAQAKKEPLSTVLATDSPAGSIKDQSAEILAALHELMESKFDSMISAIKDGNDISDKLLKYSQV